MSPTIAIIRKSTGALEWKLMYSAARQKANTYNCEIRWNAPESEADYPQQASHRGRSAARHVSEVILHPQALILHGTNPRSLRYPLCRLRCSSACQLTQQINLMSTIGFVILPEDLVKPDDRTKTDIGTLPGVQGRYVCVFPATRPQLMAATLYFFAMGKELSNVEPAPRAIYSVHRIGR
jgi:hypothetical protein